VRDPSARLPTPKPPRRPDAGADPLAALLRDAATDPATDPRVAEWLRRLLDGDAGEQVPPVRDTHELAGRATR
jgi:hypothetical protein